MQNRLLLAGLCPILAILHGCATLPAGERDPRDRFERMNRSVFAFNQVLDRNVARPVAQAYRAVLPDPVRGGITNFLANLSYSRTIVSDVLQGKWQPAVRDTGRLLVNSTLGIGGLFDPATRMGLEANDEDLGQTMGKWGIPQGPFLMVPILGPMTIRDGIGRTGDLFTTLRPHVFEDDAIGLSLWALDLVDSRAQLLDADAIMDRAFDPYVFMRNAYLQRREYLVTDGEAATEYEEVPEDEAP